MLVCPGSRPTLHSTEEFIDNSRKTRGKYIHRVSQEECARLRDGVPYVKVY